MTATHDALGQLTSVTQPVSGSQGITESYAYDLNGNQTAVTGGNATYTTYTPAATVCSFGSLEGFDRGDLEVAVLSEWEPDPAEVADLFGRADELTDQLRPLLAVLVPDADSVENNPSALAYWARHYGSDGGGESP